MPADGIFLFHIHRFSLNWSFVVLAPLTHHMTQISSLPPEAEAGKGEKRKRDPEDDDDDDDDEDDD